MTRKLIVCYAEIGAFGKPEFLFVAADGLVHAKQIVRRWALDVEYKVPIDTLTELKGVFAEGDPRIISQMELDGTRIAVDEHRQQRNIL